MAVFSAVFTPAQASGGIEDNQQVINLATTTASSTLTIGVRSIIAISVQNGTTTGAVLGACVRFSKGSSTAASTDFNVPLNTIITLDLGDAFDSVSFYNPNGTGTLTINVMRLSRT